MRNALPGADPSAAARASDEVIDAIAEIEVKRREAEKEAGLAASCSSAVLQLQELLQREKGALQAHGADAGPPANVDAVLMEIERVKRLAAARSQRSSSAGASRAGPWQESRKKTWQNAPRNPARNKGRRTMGRGGGR